MPLLYPTQGTLTSVFHQQLPLSPPSQERVASKRTKYQARSDLYPAYSVVEDAKVKANTLGNEASKEFSKASSKAQAKAGHIELYTAKYYAACTFGGLMACVCSTTLAKICDTDCTGRVLLTPL